MLQRPADRLLEKVFFRPAGRRDHLVPVRDADHKPCRLRHRVCILPCKRIQFHHRRVLLQNDLPLTVREDL